MVPQQGVPKYDFLRNVLQGVVDSPDDSGPTGTHSQPFCPFCLILCSHRLRSLLMQCSDGNGCCCSMFMPNRCIVHIFSCRQCWRLSCLLLTANQCLISRFSSVQHDCVLVKAMFVLPTCLVTPTNITPPAHKAQSCHMVMDHSVSLWIACNLVATMLAMSLHTKVYGS